MQVLEKHVEGLVIAWAEDHGWLCPKLQWVGQTGWPDRTFIKGGRVVFIEFKRHKGRRRAKQEFWIQKIGEYGGEAYFCDNVEDGIRLLFSYE